MKFPLEKVFLAAVGLLVLAILFVVAYIFIPSSDARSFLATTAMILIVLSGTAVAILSLLGLLEVVTSKNDNGYKIIWALALFFFGILGFAAYYFLARKDLK